MAGCDLIKLRFRSTGTRFFGEAAVHANLGNGK
jgi:hypothetical protein